jgi:putative membrane protein insertion efficiency factor
MPDFDAVNVRDRPQELRVVQLAARLPGLLGRGLIQAYRYTLSPLIGFHCRHLPTCSGYSDQALDRFGLWAGGWMTLARLCRCQPWGTAGLDFVPEQLPPQSHWYIPWRYGRWRGTNAGPSGETANSGLPSPLH